MFGLGVDVVMTDRPDLAKRLLGRMTEALRLWPSIQGTTGLGPRSLWTPTDACGDAATPSSRSTSRSPAGVEHDPEEIWATVERAAAQALAEAGGAGREVGRRRDHESARDDPRLGACHGGADPPGVVWQCRRTAPLCDRLRARRGSRSSASVPGSCSTPTSPERRSAGFSTRVAGARAKAERGQLAFGTVDSWLIWKLTGRPRARDRRDQRVADALLNLRAGRLGRRAARTPPAVPRAVLPAVVASSGVLGRDRGTRLAAARRAGRRDRRRPAGRALRPGLLRARHREEHVRNRRLPAPQYAEPRARRFLARAPHDHRVAHRRRDDVMLSRAACSSRALRCNGCATASGSSSTRRRARRWRGRFPTRAVSTSFPPSSGWARRVGHVRTRHESVRPDARTTVPTSRVRRSRRWRSRARDVLVAMAADAGRRGWERLRGGRWRRRRMMFVCQFSATFMDVEGCAAVTETDVARRRRTFAGLGTGLWGSLDDLAGRWTLSRRLRRRPLRLLRARGPDRGVAPAVELPRAGGELPSLEERIGDGSEF